MDAPLIVLYSALIILPALRSVSRNAKIYERVPYAIIVSVPLLLEFNLAFLSAASFAWWIIFGRYFFNYVTRRTTSNAATLWTAALTFFIFCMSFNVWYRSMSVLVPLEYAAVLLSLLYIRVFIK